MPAAIRGWPRPAAAMSFPASAAPCWPRAGRRSAALCGAVHIHGLAADLLVASGDGPIGIAASELIPAARSILNRLIAADA
jgi:NAD(P)H-hydrate repair Nnr-like enzyme with NAD(P)H-hydrate dehydratase domain